MNMKFVLTNIALLPQHIVERNINSIAFSIRKPMVLEALREEPNLTVIHTLYQLDQCLTDHAPEKLHTLDSSALFVLNAQADDRDDKTKRNEARTRLMRSVAEGRTMAPRSAKELEHMIDLELQRAEDMAATNFGKAVDAVRLIESCHSEDISDEVRYDEGELPEWVVDAIHDKVLEIAMRTYSDARRTLSRNMPPFASQRIKAEAARTGALQLLDKFDIKEEQVIEWEQVKLKNTERLFDRLEQVEAPAPTIDEPAPSVTTYVDPKEGRTVHRTNQRRSGKTSQVEQPK